MKAMIFAAGRGQRMRPLTDHTPKPLLEAGGKPLIAWQLEKLHKIGVKEVVINIAHLAEQFPATLGDGSRWQLKIHYVHETGLSLETGGGLLNALPLLGPRPFLLLSGDIWCDTDVARLPREPCGLAHLLLVDNPAHHPQGDFLLTTNGQVRSPRNLPSDKPAANALTFAGIAVCRPALLDGWRDIIGDNPGTAHHPPRFRLAPLLHAAADKGALTGQHHLGQWTDVGTPQRLQALRDALAGS